MSLSSSSSYGFCFLWRTWWQQSLSGEPHIWHFPASSLSLSLSSFQALFLARRSAFFSCAFVGFFCFFTGFTSLP